MNEYNEQALDALDAIAEQVAALAKAIDSRTAQTAHALEALTARVDAQQRALLEMTAAITRLVEHVSRQAVDPINTADLAAMLTGPLSEMGGDQ